MRWDENCRKKIHEISKCIRLKKKKNPCFEAGDKVEISPMEPSTCFLRIMPLSCQKSLPASEDVPYELWCIQVTSSDDSDLTLIEAVFSACVTLYKAYKRRFWTKDNKNQKRNTLSTSPFSLNAESLTLWTLSCTQLSWWVPSNSEYFVILRRCVKSACNWASVLLEQAHFSDKVTAYNSLMSNFSITLPTVLQPNNYFSVIFILRKKNSLQSVVLASGTWQQENSTCNNPLVTIFLLINPRFIF